MKLLCVFTELLGNRTFSARLVEALGGIEDLEPQYVYLKPEDYRRFRAPAWIRLSDPLEAQWILGRKLESEVRGGVDAVLAHGWESALCVRHLLPHTPAAASMDVVPWLLNELMVRRPGIRAWGRQASNHLHHRAFGRIARDVDFFLPMTNWCAGGLRSGYGVEPDRCFTTLGPLDLDAWKPGRREGGEKFRLLFVGNDFERKGGEFLLELYERELSDRCTLTIASCDPALTTRRLPAGVELVYGRGQAELLTVYQSSDLFVFPTRRDMMGHVLAEALSVGVPCIATDVGGISDLVRDGENGYLMPYGASTAEWAARIRHLMERTDLQRSFAVRARAFAEESLGVPRFQAVIRGVVERLRDRVGKKGRRERAA